MVAVRDSNIQLLALKETIQTNPSSNQLIQTLDDLMMKALELITMETRYLHYAFVELLPHVLTNARRKLSAIPPQERADILFSFIVSDHKPSKVQLIKDLRLERTIYFKVLEDLDPVFKEYIAKLPKALKTGDYREIGPLVKKARGRPETFYKVCTHTRFWGVRTYNYRNMIVEKFIRLARVEAVKAKAGTALNISLNDLQRGMQLAIFTGINKYDVTQGTLTNYIKWWFFDAKTNQSYHEEGVAYTVPTQARKNFLDKGNVNIAEPLDEQSEAIQDPRSIVDTIAREQEHRVVSNLACRADNDKVFCILNELTYTLTSEDRNTIRATL